MKILLGFFGFIRKLITVDEIINFKKLIPSNATIEVCINCPNKINEFSNDNISDETIQSLRNIFSSSDIKIADFTIFEYTPQKYVSKAKSKNFPFQTESVKLYPFRIFSLFDGISTLCQNMINQSIYDVYILTRFDLLKDIHSLGNCIINTNDTNIHIWRTSPYCSITDADDRLIISSFYGIKILTQLYNFIDVLDYDDTTFWTEKIMGKFLITHEDLQKNPLQDVIINLSCNIYKKYSDDMNKNCSRLWNMTM